MSSFSQRGMIDMYNYEEATAGISHLITREDAQVLLETAEVISPKVIVEIGVDTGGSSTVLATVARESGGHLFSIEPMPKELWDQNMSRLELDPYATLIEAYSPWLSAEQMSLIPRPIDYLFIDGDHLTQACLTDYYFWQHYVRRGGRVAFHDWCSTGRVDHMIRTAVNIILETDCLHEVGRADQSPNFGVVVFEKAF